MVAEACLKKTGKLLEMGVEELAESLIKITSRLPEKEAEQIRQHISSTRVKTLGLITNAAQDLNNSNSQPQIFTQGIIGGAPLLPPFYKWPDDRYNQPMIFLAQFDLTSLPAVHQGAPEDGLITIFRSAAAASLNSKDRKGFAITYIKESDRKTATRVSHPDNVHLPATAFSGGVTWTIEKTLNGLKSNLELPFDLQKELDDWISSFNALSKCSAQLFGSNVSGLQQLQETCAFAFNGISYNSARAADPHYAHLLTDAREWLLLARIGEKTLFGASHPVSETLVLIREQDLQERLFERAWMIVRTAAQ